MNVHKLMAAARAARQLEAEVQRLEAERHSLQGRLAAEAAEHQRCRNALDDAHATENRCYSCLALFFCCIYMAAS
jgi:predicted  nucleic acid-binding Zn-ribbon protein